MQHAKKSPQEFHPVAGSCMGYITKLSAEQGWGSGSTRLKLLLFEAVTTSTCAGMCLCIYIYIICVCAYMCIYVNGILAFIMLVQDLSDMFTVHVYIYVNI